MKVMIIDDEPVHVRGITKHINWTKFGYDKVVGAYSAKEALRILGNERIDLVVTDINMPEISGLELIHRIYLLGKEPDIMIVSGYNEFTYAQEAIRLGVFAYILKPVKIEELEENLLILTEKRKRKPLESQIRDEYDMLCKIKGEDGRKAFNEKEVVEGNSKRKVNCEIKREDVEQVGFIQKEQDIYQDSLNDRNKNVNQDWFDNTLQEMNQDSLNDKKEDEIQNMRKDNGVIKQKKLHPSIQKALLYIGKNYHDELSVQDLAIQLNMNESYLSALFKKEVGMNLSSYLQRYRLHRAMDLLKNSDLRINEIAYRVGYQNPCYFTEQFKKIYNTTPREVRKV